MSNLVSTTPLVNALFPTPVVTYKLPRDFTKSELDFIKNIPRGRKNLGNKTSDDDYVFNFPELSDLGNFAKSCLEDYIRNIFLITEDAGLRITQSWINFTEKGEYHHIHMHPNSVFSGVMYISADESDRITFQKQDWRTYVFKHKEWNLFNSNSWWLKANTGDVIIFPSSLPHKVEPVTADNTRISLAFNSFPIGTLGNALDLTELKL